MYVTLATALRLAFVFWMVCPFLHFMTAGANTFIVPKLKDNGAVLGQISFVSGMVCVQRLDPAAPTWVNCL